MTAETVSLVTHPLFLAVLGAMVGSFLNVVIHRVPRKMSIVRPPSHCPECEKPIAPWQNVPVLSWLVLRAITHRTWRLGGPGSEKIDHSRGRSKP